MSCSVALKLNFSIKCYCKTKLCQHVKTLFQIQNVSMKDLHLKPWKPCIETKFHSENLTAKMCQQKPCFEFKMFEWKCWSKTKFLNKSLAVTPNSTNRILLSNSKCLYERLALKPNFSTKFLLWNQNVPTNALFWIENVWINVMKWKQIFQQKSCC